MQQWHALASDLCYYFPSATLSPPLKSSFLHHPHRPPFKRRWLRPSCLSAGGEDIGVKLWMDLGKDGMTGPGWLQRLGYCTNILAAISWLANRWQWRFFCTSCLPSGGRPGYCSPDLLSFFFQSSLAGICLTKEKHLNYRIATLGVKQWGKGWWKGEWKLSLFFSSSFLLRPLCAS